MRETQSITALNRMTIHWNTPYTPVRIITTTMPSTWAYPAARNGAAVMSAPLLRKTTAAIIPGAKRARKVYIPRILMRFTIKRIRNI